MRELGSGKSHLTIEQIHIRHQARLAAAHKGMKHTGPNAVPRKLGPNAEDKRMESRLKREQKKIDNGASMTKKEIREVNALIGHHNKHKLGRTLPFIRSDGSRYEE